MRAVQLSTRTVPARLLLAPEIDTADNSVLAEKCASSSNRLLKRASDGKQRCFCVEKQRTGLIVDSGAERMAETSVMGNGTAGADVTANVSALQIVDHFCFEYGCGIPSSFSK